MTLAKVWLTTPGSRGLPSGWATLARGIAPPSSPVPPAEPVINWPTLIAVIVAVAVVDGIIAYIITRGELVKLARLFNSTKSHFVTTRV